MRRSLRELNLSDNHIGQDGFNEVLKFMELTSNYLEEVDLRWNKEFVGEQNELVCVLDVLSRNQIQLFKIVSLLVMCIV